MLIYLTADEVKIINLRFMGMVALRDESTLLGALARPMTVAHYQQADLAEQAAVLIDGIAQAHAFIDGNKRTATAAGLLFLRLNGYTVRYSPDPQDDELGRQVLTLVTHQTTINAFASWLRVRLITLP